MCVTKRTLTEEGSADLCGGRFPHFQRGLLTVPGCVWSADQIGRVFKGTLGETAKIENRGIQESATMKKDVSQLYSASFSRSLTGTVRYTTPLPEGLALVDVQGCSPYSALLQSLSQSFLIHQATPCRVHQECSLTHLQGTEIHTHTISRHTMTNRVIWA